MHPWYKAEYTISDQLTGPIGNQTVVNFPSPKIWYLVFADEHTCQQYDINELQDDSINFIYYDIQLLNPDALGNAKEHFSDEETGICTFNFHSCTVHLMRIR